MSSIIHWQGMRHKNIFPFIIDMLSMKGIVIISSDMKIKEMISFSGILNDSLQNKKHWKDKWLWKMVCCALILDDNTGFYIVLSCVCMLFILLSKEFFLEIKYQIIISEVKTYSTALCINDNKRLHIIYKFYWEEMSRVNK